MNTALSRPHPPHITSTAVAPVINHANDGLRSRRVAGWLPMHPGLGEITDPQQATAAQLADCYHQRWESETAYKSLKTHQRRSRQVLRSQDPDGVAQELHAYLITYQDIHQLMNQAAVAADIDPDRLLNNRRLVRRYEHKAEHFQAFADLGCILICYRSWSKVTK